MYYVIDLNKGYVSHQDKDYERCVEYIRNSQELFNAGPFLIKKGAKDRDEILRNL